MELEGGKELRSSSNNMRVASKGAPQVADKEVKGNEKEHNVHEPGEQTRPQRDVGQKRFTGCRAFAQHL